ncbi:MAG: hypothetical protein M2R45_03184 [Verrucomicrobia subdivision 3 bacterium]|nr:hypothetical protein [Limisphaerales bacterium]MCS1417741.1 hypothetical protein [Limisphaerales bacterium]
MPFPPFLLGPFFGLIECEGGGVGLEEVHVGLINELDVICSGSAGIAGLGVDCSGVDDFIGGGVKQQFSEFFKARLALPLSRSSMASFKIDRTQVDNVPAPSTSRQLLVRAYAHVD